MEKPWFESDADSISLIVPAVIHGVRLDQFLAQTYSELSRSQLSASIKSGDIRVNGDLAKAGYRLKSGDEISGVLESDTGERMPEAQDVAFTVLLEDPAFLVINKPPGLVVHPGSGNADHTLINGLLHRYRDIAEVGDEARPGIVHRLDKDTSGVMVVARTRKSHSSLVSQFKNRQVEKIYLALIHGLIETDQGRIAAPIGRHPVHRQKMAVREAGGNYAASSWRLVKRFARLSLVKVHIETGRTHQIRVHLASVGHPVAGDLLYGPNRPNSMFARQMLHSWKLQFFHPETGRKIEVEADLPEDFSAVLQELEAS